MLATILAQVHVWSSWGIGEFAIAIIIVAAIVACVYLAFRQFGIQIPAFVVTIFWILVCAVVCILAIRFLLTL